MFSTVAVQRLVFPLRRRNEAHSAPIISVRAYGVGKPNFWRCSGQDSGMPRRRRLREMSGGWVPCRMASQLSGANNFGRGRGGLAVHGPANFRGRSVLERVTRQPRSTTWTDLRHRESRRRQLPTDGAPVIEPVAIFARCCRPTSQKSLLEWCVSFQSSPNRMLAEDNARGAPGGRCDAQRHPANSRLLWERGANAYSGFAQCGQDALEHLLAADPAGMAAHCHGR